MVSVKASELTARFYEWEVLGRGWLIGEEPVDLEPPFTPFFGHFLSKPIVDDGVRHTVLSTVASLFRPKVEIKSAERPSISYAPFPFNNESSLVKFELVIRKGSMSISADVEQLLHMFSYCTVPISFEIIATHEKITFQFVCRETTSHYIQGALKTYLKTVPFILTPIVSSELFDEALPFATVDFGLKEEFMRPIGKPNGIDSFSGLFSMIDHLRDNERVIFQVLFQGLQNYWASSIITAVSDAKGKPFFEDAPEMLTLAREKVGSTLCAATIRIFTQAETIEDSFSLLHKVAFAIKTNTQSPYNSFMPLSDERYTAAQRVIDIEFRESHRVGMILNTKELATLIHIPDTSLHSKKLIGVSLKTKELPEVAKGHSFLLGINSHNGIETNATVSNAQRLKHTHIIGATGTGKSTLLRTMIAQDIQNGEGLTVLDPHGDLIEGLLQLIPQERVSDVVHIDPSDSEFPIAFNILKAHSDIEKEVLSSDLVSAFRKWSTSWGDQMNAVFANAILAFLESRKEGTLIDLRRFLIEKKYREHFLQSVDDPSIRYYWLTEYPLLKTNSIGPILTRLDAFLRPRLIRNMVAQKRGINFEELLNERKILLVKLAQGLIGTENSYLLGTLIVSKVHQAALARQVLSTRPDFFFYIDEFHHFLTPSMSHILSGARKFNVGFILAHQDIQQLQKSDADLLNTIITNAGTRICFRLGEVDARRMADGFSSFEAHDFQNLETGQAIVRIEKPENDFSLTIVPFQRSDTYASRAMIVEYSRNKYSASKDLVEEQLKEVLGHGEFKTEGYASSTRKQAAFEKDEIERTTRAEPASAPQPAVLSETTVLEGFPDELVQKKEISQHKYLQHLIKKMAESKGYKATIEFPLPNRGGSIDIVVEGHSIRLACEVCVTTSAGWELHNLQKCLSAGFQYIFVCCSEKKAVGAILDNAKSTLTIQQLRTIVVGEPEQLFSYLDQFTVQAAPNETVQKGYRVKVAYDSLSQKEQQQKRDAINKVVIESLRKMKKE